MAITETLNEGLKRGYTIKVTAAELDATVNTKLKEAQPNIELKGFRKGKVPMAMLKKQHGPALLGEVMQETVDGEMNPGKVPIQELPGGGGQQTQLLISAYNYYLNMIRDVTGLNEARDGSDPSPHALVGVQKLAAANSNTATRHILHSSLFITASLAEAISIRIKDVLEFHPQKEAMIGAIGRFSVGALEEMEKLHLHDYGIFLELDPDEDEKQLVENNIQIALSKDQIFLEDAIDVRQIKNIKLANQLLKYRRTKKQKADQDRAQANIAAQSEANGKAAQAAEMAKAQAEQIKTQSKVQLSEAQSGFDIKKLEVEATTKKELMQFEFDLNLKLKKMELDAKKELSALEGKSISSTDITKKVTNPVPSKSFESKGNDVMGGIDTSIFNPR